MSLYEKIINKEEKISLVGLGYVGMPIAVAFAKKVDVIGYDLNKNKIDLYKSGIDPTQEVGDETIKNTSVFFTANEQDLKKAKFHIVAVPTPINLDHTPDLTPLEGASHILGKNLSKGSIVVYESTVYPGVTEDICVPILEKESGLKCGIDFKVGYSPERINPGDKVHRLENIHKIVSGMDEESLEEIRNIYNLVVDVGTYPVSSIKTAEAMMYGKTILASDEALEGYEVADVQGIYRCNTKEEYVKTIRLIEGKENYYSEMVRQLFLTKYCLDSQIIWCKELLL